MGRGSQLNFKTKFFTRKQIEDFSEYRDSIYEAAKNCEEPSLKQVFISQIDSLNQAMDLLNIRKEVVIVQMLKRIDSNEGN
jgi:hypothetical protein